MSVAFVDDDDVPQEEGDPDVWFTGYLTGLEEILSLISQALGPYVTLDSHGDPVETESAIVEAVQELAHRMASLDK